MSNQEKIVRLLTIIAECQIYSIYDTFSTRAVDLLMELRVIEGGEE